MFGSFGGAVSVVLALVLMLALAACDDECDVEPTPDGEEVLVDVGDVGPSGEGDANVPTEEPDPVDGGATDVGEDVPPEEVTDVGTGDATVEPDPEPADPDAGAVDPTDGGTEPDGGGEPEPDPTGPDAGDGDAGSEPGDAGSPDEG